MSAPTSMEQRVADVAAYLFSQMPAELVAETRALIALDPSSGGTRVFISDGMLHFTWCGRWLGSSPLDWIINGDDTEGEET